MLAKTLIILILLSMVVVISTPAIVEGVPNSLAYQGKLTNSSGIPVPDGSYQVQFKFYTVETGGTPTWTSAPMSVTTSGGVFSAMLVDLNESVFSSADVWLETVVGTETLSPRVKLSSVPYAFRSGDSWSLSGNSGTTPGTIFLGTSDNKALELKVNSARALRLEPNATSPNIIGGHSANSVAGGVMGATVAGGGNNISPNRVKVNYGTVSGGVNNTADLNYYTTVGGGVGNVASGYSATVGGGYYNTASGGGATVPGGFSNVAAGEYSLSAGYRAKANHQGSFVWGDSTAADFTSTANNQFLMRASGGVGIGVNNPLSGSLDVNGIIRSRTGGFHFPDGTTQTTAAVPGWSLTGNNITSGQFLGTTNSQALVLAANNSRVLRLEPHATSPNVIAGNSYNSVTTGVYGATIGGGGEGGANSNRVTDSAGTVGGGVKNRAGDDAGTTSDKSCATVSGGYSNIASGELSTVGGGWGNNASEFGSTIAGGTTNTAAGQHSTVGGGSTNRASQNYTTVGGGLENSAVSDYSTIGGGQNNETGGFDSTIGGGRSNIAHGSEATIGGGRNNRAQGFNSTIGGGLENTAYGHQSTVGGGRLNAAAGAGSMVPGGDSNAANGDFSFAAGRRAKANHQGAFVWSDSTDADFVSTASDQFVIRASGGVGIGTSAPADRLSVAGGVRVDQGEWNTGTFASGGLIKFGAGLTGEGIGSKRTLGGNWAGIDFYTGSTIKMSVTNGGNVGIGTTSPAYKLHVNGSVAGVGNYVNLSDIRYKTNINGISDALDKVEKLRGVTFDWRKDENPDLAFDEGRQIGLIAQEVEKILPEAVSKDEKGNYSVAYGSIVPLLIEAVKEQKKTIDNQQTSIDEIKAELAALKAQQQR